MPRILNTHRGRPHKIAARPAADILKDARTVASVANQSGFLGFDCDGRIVCSDARATEILTRHAPRRPVSLEDILDPVGRTQFRRALQDLNAGLTRFCHLNFEISAPHRALQFISLDLSPHRLPGGPITHILATLTDTTARELFDFQRRREEKRLRATVDNLAVGIVSTDWNGQFLEVNKQFARMLDYPADFFNGRNFRDFMHPEDITSHTDRRAALWKGNLPSVTIDRRWIRRDGRIIWARMTISVQDDLIDSEPYSVVILEDITEAKRVEESQALLVGELNHRVKNTLAVVQGIVRKTLSTALTPEAFANQIEQRLQSISRAHDLLSQNDWVDLELRDLVQTCLLNAFPAHTDAFKINVDDIGLSPHQAITLTLILHELATNALKYGALTTERGTVELTASIDAETCQNSEQDSRVTLVWREEGGPPAKPGSHKGFGQFLLRRGATHSLNGNAAITYPESGLVFSLVFPTSQQSVHSSSTSPPSANVNKSLRENAAQSGPQGPANAFKH